MQRKKVIIKKILSNDLDLKSSFSNDKFETLINISWENLVFLFPKQKKKSFEMQPCLVHFKYYMPHKAHKKKFYTNLQLSIDFNHHLQLLIKKKKLRTLRI